VACGDSWCAWSKQLRYLYLGEISKQVLTLSQTGDYHFNQTLVKGFKINVFKGQQGL